ncbi:hypothetical protein McpCs1_07560 [Methanocorpusculaceae archaeon Cs1]|uniref:Uncharacterized protein n=1 Tax=Methanorbis rubei TaxID=3028300 RepID=A0AAE4MG89_9EURY|nr:hypothetical protein [Methanocorpusculaceae archaeon Cs1]
MKKYFNGITIFLFCDVLVCSVMFFSVKFRASCFFVGGSGMKTRALQFPILF